MYTVECSYDYCSFVLPWKVTLIEPKRGMHVEMFRFRTAEEVCAMIKSYFNAFGEDNVLVSEKVYSISPRLDLVHIRG